ncbi:hypothetical protein BRC83_04505 [Halobacteriales archaeon QS_1_68_17]|nr:MAG: hypothetical protein BRC83_04505 [Halobacteriales archaeon QS_1_68_17]
MSDTDHTSETDPASDADPEVVCHSAVPELPPEALVHRIERYENRPDECTIYPSDADESAVTTQWLAATEDAFVDCSRAR